MNSLRLLRMFKIKFDALWDSFIKSIILELNIGGIYNMRRSDRVKQIETLWYTSLVIPFEILSRKLPKALNIQIGNWFIVNFQKLI